MLYLFKIKHLVSLIDFLSFLSVRQLAGLVGADVLLFHRWCLD